MGPKSMMQNYKPKSETKIKVTIKPMPTRFRHQKLQMWIVKNASIPGHGSDNMHKPSFQKHQTPKGHNLSKI